MKLNKKGWGLVTELIVILIAVILLVFAIYGLNSFGLLRNSKVLNSDYVLKVTDGNYSSIEGKMINAAEYYINRKFNGNVENGFVVRLSYLSRNGYISPIRDENNRQCSGYVKVVNGTFLPFLKCPRYMSNNYESELDW